MNINTIKNLCLSSVLFCSLATFAQTQPLVKADEITPNECTRDLQYIASFLLKNDAGIRAKHWTAYPSSIQQSLDQKMSTAALTTDINQCKTIISEFLTTIRHGHLSLQINDHADLNHSSTIDKPFEPDNLIFKKLSDQTTYLRIDSFRSSYREPLSLAVKQNTADILKAKYIIIDVKNNEGGTDSTFEPLLPLFGPYTYWDEIPLIYSSPANIYTWKALLPMLKRQKNDISSFNWLKQMITRMQSAPNQWVPMFDQTYQVTSIAKNSLVNSTKVAILIGPNCGSSCEQFILMAQQNSNIVTLGQPTFGTIDASNQRAQLTPPKKFTLWYSTTFVFRKKAPLDGVGIQPAIQLPRFTDSERNQKIRLIQNLLEQNAI